MNPMSLAALGAFAARRRFVTLALSALAVGACSKSATPGPGSGTQPAATAAPAVPPTTPVAPAPNEAAAPAGGAPSGAAGAPGAASGGAAVAAEAPPSEAAQLAQVMEAYEAARRLLAVDDTPGAGLAAKALAELAKQAAAGAKGEVATRLDAVATAANAMWTDLEKGPEALRKGFGQVSQALIALMQADPSLRSGRFVFECPMAKGYKQWVQTTNKISNPYMGKRMPTCGVAGKW